MATNTTEVHRIFVEESMGEKTVEEVPGIGKAIGKRLREDDVTTAKKLYDMYQKSSEKEFKKLISKYRGNREHQEDAFRGMKEWEETMANEKKLQEFNVEENGGGSEHEDEEGTYRVKKEWEDDDDEKITEQKPHSTD